MKLRKFFGLTSRSVLDQIRAELGADAVIVANHPTARGVEISALAGDAMDTILGDAEAPIQRPRRSAVGKPPLHVADQSVPAPSEEALPATRIDTTPAAAPKAECEAGTFPKFEPVDSAPLDSRLTNELAALRSLLEGQFAQLAWSDSLRRTPLRAQLTQELMTVGYSPGLAREITQRLPDDYTPAQAQQWLMGVMSKNVRCVDSSDDIVSRGGVYALVGPTGVGKTTTTAKLAARCAVRHGSASLALLTTDSYRVGAHDHLRIYAKILGVSVQTVNDARDLRQAVDALQSKHLVLIDTVGMGQRDARVAEHSAMLAQPDVRRLLLLNAASQSETLEEVVAAYGARDTDAASGHRGCIITKQDESARPGQVLDVIIRHQLQLHYVSNGQRVPEDLQTANAGYLVHRSFKQLAQVSAFRLQRHEVPLMLAARGAIHV